ncbi:MAG: hypothetical protein N2171_08240 [Clostridia bacterium]|nr:hypothetical protein [Clostridia bacterium]
MDKVSKKRAERLSIFISVFRYGIDDAKTRKLIEPSFKINFKIDDIARRKDAAAQI